LNYSGFYRGKKLKVWNLLGFSSWQKIHNFPRANIRQRNWILPNLDRDKRYKQGTFLDGVLGSVERRNKKNDSF